MSKSEIHHSSMVTVEQDVDLTQEAKCFRYVCRISRVDRFDTYLAWCMEKQGLG